MKKATPQVMLRLRRHLGRVRLVLLIWAVWAIFPVWFWQTFGLAVALDTAGTSATANAVLTLDVTMTVGAGANRAIVAQLCFSTQTPTALTVVWDPAGANQSLTSIGFVNTGSPGVGRSVLFGLVNPTTGAAKPLRATWTTNSSDIVLDACSWTGVNQTGGATSFAFFSNTGGSTAPSVAVTSASGNSTMDVTTTSAGGYSAPTQTQVFLDNTPTAISGAGSRAAGAATVTHGWTLDVSGNWASAGVNIVAAAAADTLFGQGVC